MEFSECSNDEFIRCIFYASALTIEMTANILLSMKILHVNQASAIGKNEMHTLHHSLGIFEPVRGPELASRPRCLVMSPRKNKTTHSNCITLNINTS